MKKLTNREVTALANKIYNEMDTAPPKAVITHFQNEVKKWSKSPDIKILRKYNLKPEIDNIGLKPFNYQGTRYAVGSNHNMPGYCRTKYIEEFGFTDILSGYKRLYSNKMQVGIIQIENAIVLAQIECKDLETLINTIKDQFS